ncbi:MAG: hypothetical protein ACXWWC_12635 [Chitinophagaceae bacterium]
MKKWLIGICVTLFLLFLAGSYYFIPQNIVISRDITSGSNQSGVFRFLSIHTNWQNWWPGEAGDLGKDSVLKYNGYKFKLNDVRYNALGIIVSKDQKIDTSILHILPIGVDSTRIVWDAFVRTGNNPFQRIRQYYKAKKLRNNIDGLLAQLQSFLSDNKNVYGIDIKNEQVKIEYVVSTKKVFHSYPGTEAIYEMINNIKKYISQYQAKEEDYPMVNIKSIDSTNYLAQVGIPIASEIPPTDEFFLKRLLKNGHILVAEVKGGRDVADSAMNKMELFVYDHKLVNIALPFLSLVTDRMKEKDSTEWITKVYYPIN